MQFPLPKGGNGAGAPPRGTEETAGALGRGLQFSSALGLLFTFLAYVIPIFGGWLADTKLGRFQVIMIGTLVAGIAHVIMILGALPSVLQAGHGIGPFMVSFFILAIGAGTFKPNVCPTVIDQYTHQREYTKVLKSGEKVLVDPETTVQRIMLWFYGFINVGAFFAIATTYAEKDVGYWLAFLLPGILYLALPIILLGIYKRIVKKPPNGSELNDVFRIIATALKRNKGNFWAKNFWDKAMPSNLAAEGITVHWNDKLVGDVKRTLSACAVFLYFPIYNINDGGIGSVSTSQGSTLTTKGAPNDLLSNFNPLTIIVAIPILSHVVYPTLRHFNIRFGRIKRITFGFALATISGVCGAIVQWRVYKTSPCGYYATDCDVGSGVSSLSIWIQLPNIMLGALSECFCNVTSYELAYARSPPSMKAFVMALCLFSTALSSALGEIVTPAINDPHLIWVWGGPAIALAVQTVIFWFRWKHMDEDEFLTYEEEVEVERRASIASPDEKRVPETIPESPSGSERADQPVSKEIKED